MNTDKIEVSYDVSFQINFLALKMIRLYESYSCAIS